jgi:hypothetical protein
MFSNHVTILFIEEKTMKRFAIFAAALIFAFVGSAMAGPAPQKVVDLANGALAELGKDKIVVRAVRDANADAKTMKQIESIDSEWKAAKKAGQKIPLMDELLNNKCAKQLNKMMAEHAFITEIFVTDNQGGNVCQTGMTGDYWQGDEAKFKKVYKGSVLVSEVEVDGGKNVSQVSVPVIMGKRHVGTMTIGVDVDKVP